MEELLTNLDDSLHILLEEFNLLNVERAESRFISGMSLHDQRQVESLSDLPSMLFEANRALSNNGLKCFGPLLHK